MVDSKATQVSQFPQLNSCNSLVEEKESPETSSSEKNKMVRDMRKAMERLASALKPYMPLHRQPGKWVFENSELIIQSEEEKPFNAIGTILMATRILSIWEKLIGESLGSRIGKISYSLAFTPLRRTLETLQLGKKEKQNIQAPANTSCIERGSPQELMKATLPHQSPSQAIAHALTLPKDQQKFQKHAVLGKGMVFTKEVYLRRLELENLVYRQHMHDLEQNLYTNVLADISNLLDLDKESSEAATKSAARVSRALSTEPRMQATKAKGKSAVKSRAPHINDKKSPAKRKADVQKPRQPTVKRRRWNASPKAKETSNAKAQSNANVNSSEPQDKRGQLQQSKPEIVDLTQMATERSAPGASASSKNSSLSTNKGGRPGDV